jgi:hypothetical protein
MLVFTPPPGTVTFARTCALGKLTGNLVNFAELNSFQSRPAHDSEYDKRR